MANMVTYYEIWRAHLPHFLGQNATKSRRPARPGKIWVRLETPHNPPDELRTLAATRPVDSYRKTRVAVPAVPGAQEAFDAVAGRPPFSRGEQDGNLVLCYRVPPAQRHALLMLERMALL